MRIITSAVKVGSHVWSPATGPTATPSSNLAPDDTIPTRLSQVAIDLIVELRHTPVGKRLDAPTHRRLASTTPPRTRSRCRAAAGPQSATSSWGVTD